MRTKLAGCIRDVSELDRRKKLTISEDKEKKWQLLGNVEKQGCTDAKILTDIDTTIFDQYQYLNQKKNERKLSIYTNAVHRQ